MKKRNATELLEVYKALREPERRAFFQKNWLQLGVAARAAGYRVPFLLTPAQLEARPKGARARWGQSKDYIEEILGAMARLSPQHERARRSPSGVSRKRLLYSELASAMGRKARTVRREMKAIADSMPGVFEELMHGEPDSKRRRYVEACRRLTPSQRRQLAEDLLSLLIEK